MEISYTDSWDKIQKQMQLEHYQAPAYREAEAAFKIKSAIESIKNAKRLTKATIVLAVFTGILVLSTLAYTKITYNALQGSQKQVEALNELTKAVNEAPKALIKFQQWSKSRKKLDEIEEKRPTGQRALTKP